jgi:hypothetical protein
MKKQAIIFLFCLLFVFKSTFAFAGKLIVFAVNQRKAVSISIIRAPDCLAIPVKITSDQKDPKIRFKEIKEARDLLIKTCDNNKIVTFYSGPVYLSPVSKSFLKSSYSSYRSSVANNHLIVSLADQKIDIFDAAVMIARLVKAINTPGKASYQLSRIELGVENPEKYRVELVKMIVEDIKKIKNNINSTEKVIISGLESPVLIRQVNDTEVELFLDYELSLELKGK